MLVTIANDLKWINTWKFFNFNYFGHFIIPWLERHPKNYLGIISGSAWKKKQGLFRDWGSFRGLYSSAQITKTFEFALKLRKELTTNLVGRCGGEEATFASKHHNFDKTLWTLITVRPIFHYFSIIIPLESKHAPLLNESCNMWCRNLAPVVQRVERAIHWIKFYPVANAIGFPNTYLLDCDWSGGQRYPRASLEQVVFDW